MAPIIQVLNEFVSSIGPAKSAMLAILGFFLTVSLATGMVMAMKR